MRLDKLKYGVPKDDNNSNTRPGGGGGSGGTLGPPGPPRIPQQEIDKITERLDRLRGNTADVSHYNTREENSRIIARKSNEKLVIDRLNKDKDSFQVCQKELLIKEGQVLILGFLIHLL